MIAVDTNVLLRYLLGDDAQQAEQASLLIGGQESVLITDVVLVETIWTLSGRKYLVDKEGIVDMVEALFREPNVCFEDDQTVWRALQTYRGAESVKGGKRQKGVDFADALIVYKAQSTAAARGGQLTAVYTFDAPASRLPCARIPSSGR